MSDDFFGGMYDFNRDGETDLSEQAIGMQMLMNNLNGDDKDYDDESWSEYFEKRRAAKAQKVKPEPIKFTPPPVPECPTREEYKAYQKRLRAEIGAHLFAAAVPSVPAVILSWAAISTMSESNETLGVIVCLVILIIVWVIAGAMITGAFSGFGDVLERGQKLKENYKNAKKNNMIPLKKSKEEKVIKIKNIIKVVIVVLSVCLIITGGLCYEIDRKNTIIEELTKQATDQGLNDVAVTIIEKDREYNWYDVSIYASNIDSLSYQELFEVESHIYVSNAFVVSFKSNNNVYSDSIYKNGKEVWERTVVSKGGECALGHCDFKAEPGKTYCSRHGCCKDDCDRRKDPMVHCCDIHNCAAEGCGLHRYDYANSKYCNVHYNKMK